MKTFSSIISFLFLITFATAQKNNSLESQLSEKRVRLPNGWHLSPAGRSLPLGDFPLNLVVSSSKKLMAVTNNGQSVQSLQLLNPKTEKVLSTIIIPKSWYGLKFSADEKFLYASGGNDNWILQYSISNNKLKLTDSILLG
ncbi:MAG: hypothetical protein ABIO05_05545, partial [Ferruginibacter sp.]